MVVDYQVVHGRLLLLTITALGAVLVDVCFQTFLVTLSMYVTVKNLKKCVPKIEYVISRREQKEIRDYARILK